MIQTLLLVCSFSICTAQTVEKSDAVQTDSLILQPMLPDSTQTDSLTQQTNPSDSIAQTKTMPISPNAVTSIVDYFAQDSVEFDIKNKKSLLFNNTNLLYEDIELKSHYVEIDFSKNELHAEGMTDTNAILQGTPVFKQGTWEFKSHELNYNFNTKKGLIKNVITQEGEGYLHGEIVKKNSDNTSYIRHGKYTTCNLEHPHFEIDFGKAKVIPNEKIVTGPLYLRIANVPTFLALPFGFFPNSNKRTNGLLIPGGYGTDQKLGYYIPGLGYYFAVKDMVDFAITADIYMETAFGVGVVSNYIKRYKGNGKVDVKYNYRLNSDLPKDSNRVSHDLKIVWRHQQDRKSHPVNNFSANVDFQTSGFRDNSANVNYNDRIKSVSSSSISFSTSFKSRYSLGINANISQNLSTGDLGLDLPQINFNVQQFYPLRKKKRIGKLRWYEEISMQYTANMRNGLHTTDTTLFRHPNAALRTFNSELTHSIPIKSTIKIFKYISWGNSITISETWQTKACYQSWKRDSIDYKGDSILYYGHVEKDTASVFKGDFKNALKPIHNLSYNSDLSTTLYGMYMMKKGRVYAFRHTFTPSVGFTYRPAINKWLYPSYYDSASGKKVDYSIVSASYDIKTSAAINFALNNRLEMKVRKKVKDGEEEEFKKVTLLESFSISTFYDFMRDSLKLNPISISGRTLLFKYINLNFSLALDPYAYDDSLGVRTNTTELEKNHRLFRLSNTAWTVSCGLNLNKDFFKPKNKEKTEETPTYGFKDWNISINYNFVYNMNENPFYYRYLQRPDTLLLKYDHIFRNIMNLSGRIALTSKWALNFTSGYDFTEKKISASMFTIERDLHCWLMEFKWEPFGSSRRFEFCIQAKANMLRDVKWNPKRQYVDY